MKNLFLILLALNSPTFAEEEEESSNEFSHQATPSPESESKGQEQEESAALESQDAYQQKISSLTNQINSSSDTALREKVRAEINALDEKRVAQSKGLTESLKGKPDASAASERLPQSILDSSSKLDSLLVRPPPRPVEFRVKPRLGR